MKLLLDENLSDRIVPKLVFLRIGNCPTREIFALLSEPRGVLASFAEDAAASILILSPKPRLL